MTDKAFNESINDVGLEHFNNSIPLIRGDFVQSMITALSRRGLDPKPIFKSSKLDPNLVKQSKMVAIHQLGNSLKRLTMPCLPKPSATAFNTLFVTYLCLNLQEPS